jgi:acetoacetate decarboxylase
VIDLPFLLNDERHEKRVKQYSRGGMLIDVDIMVAMFRTDPEVIASLLPPPLEPGAMPIATAYIAEFHQTNFGIVYNEAALFIPAAYNGEEGKYCLSMPVDNDMGLIAGREVFGYPKKIAEKIYVTRKDDTVTGECVRKGVPLYKMSIDLKEQLTEKTPPAPNFLIKFFPGCDYLSVDRGCYLMRQVNPGEGGKWWQGDGELELNSSKDDPLGDVPVEEVVAYLYGEGTTIIMQAAEFLAEVDPKEVYPYLFFKYDFEM